MKEFIAQWNLRFKYDRKWRKKYNIPFGSKEHLESNQIDIYFDLLEDNLFHKLQKEYIELMKDSEEFKNNGKFLRDQVLSQEEEDKLYKKIKLSL